jgi:hypothetical protein
MQKSEADIRHDYADLIAPSDGTEHARLLAGPDAGLASADPDASRWDRVPLSKAESPGGKSRDQGGAKLAARIRQQRGMIATCVAVLVVFSLAGTALALSTAPNLGRPTDAKPPQSQVLPLGSFQRSGPVLRSGRKPELVFLGTQVDAASAAERWAVVKALAQFGTLTGVNPLRQRRCQIAVGGARADCGPAANYPWSRVGWATFDWRHAQYQSRYLAFSHADLIDSGAHLMRQRQLTLTQLKLFNRFVRQNGYASWADAVWQTATNLPLPNEPSRHFPLVAVGGYAETGAELSGPGDIVGDTGGGFYIPFATIQRSLQTGRLTSTESRGLITDVNAEANIITALICHADGARPRSVCSRPTIASMTRSVK